MSNPLPQHGELTLIGRFCAICSAFYPLTPQCVHLQEMKAAATAALSEKREPEHYDGDEVAISVWKFPRQGEQFQIVAKDTQVQAQGKGYLLLSLVGAAQLYRQLGEALRKRGVIV